MYQSLTLSRHLVENAPLIDDDHLQGQRLRVGSLQGLLGNGLKPSYLTKYAIMIRVPRSINQKQYDLFPKTV
jgi:hypothetical protein